MPLVRVTGVDADAFDISDVARMNDHNHSRNKALWHSRPKHSLSPSDNTDETPSTDSSSMVSSVVHSERDGGASNNMGGRHSFASVNSVSSTLLSNPHNGGGNNNRSYNISGSGNSTYDNYYDDPRNPFDTQKIPEEDEDGSSAAMEECSLSGTVSSYRGAQHHQQQQQQQQRNAGFKRTDSLRSQSTMSSSSKHHSSSKQQRHHNVSASFREEEEDDLMSSTSSIRSSSIRNRDSAISAYNSQLVSQLESQVAKINFELATTKSDMDQIKLENRKLQDEKAEWQKKTRLLQEENDQLHQKIERMERDKLMRTMESTKGVGRVRTSMDVGSCVVWGGSSVSGNTWRDSRGSGRENGDTITTHKQELKQVEKLDVSFRDSDNEKSHSYKQAALRSSFASTGTYQSYEDLDKSIGSVGSVNLDNSSEKIQELEEDITNLRSSFQNALGTLRPMQRLQGINKRVTSAPNQRKNDEETSIQSNSLASATAAAVDDAAAASDDDDDDKMGHIEEEEYDDDDPFATWSENRERLSSKKKWYQRGDGQKQPQSQNIDVEEEEITSRAHEERIEEDPFDTAKGENKETEYTSFADAGNRSDDASEDFGSVTQQPRRGFRLPWQRGDGNEGR
eukprot:scaffold13651_cov118-Skeletonema_dohrnii-CCMP3373.AAC.3